MIRKEIHKVQDGEHNLCSCVLPFSPAEFGPLPVAPQTEPDGGGMSKQSLLQRKTQHQVHSIEQPNRVNQICQSVSTPLSLHQYLMETQWGQTLSENGAKDTSGPKK